MSVTVGPPISVWFISDLSARFPNFYAAIFPLSSTVDCLCSWPWRARVQCANERGWEGSRRWQKNVLRCAREIILAWKLLRQVKAWSKSWSRSRRGLGRRSPRIMQEYDPKIVITIRSWIQPRMCKMGSSIFLSLVDTNSWVQPGITFQVCH